MYLSVTPNSCREQRAKSFFIDINRQEEMVEKCEAGVHTPACLSLSRWTAPIRPMSVKNQMGCVLVSLSRVVIGRSLVSSVTTVSVAALSYSGT